MRDIFQDKVNKIIAEHDSLKDYLLSYTSDQYQALIQQLFNNYFYEFVTGVSCNTSNSIIEKQLIKVIPLRKYLSVQNIIRPVNGDIYCVNDEVFSWVKTKSKIDDIRWLFSAHINHKYYTSDLDLIYKFLEVSKSYLVALGATQYGIAIIDQHDENHFNVKICLCTRKIKRDVFEHFFNPFYRNEKLSITPEMSLSIAILRDLAEKRGGEISITEGHGFIGFELRLQKIDKAIEYASDSIYRLNDNYNIYINSYDHNFSFAVRNSLDLIENLNLFDISINELCDIKNINLNHGKNILFVDARFGSLIKNNKILLNYFNKVYLFNDDFINSKDLNLNTHSLLDSADVFSCFLDNKTTSKNIASSRIETINRERNKIVFIYDKNPIYGQNIIETLKNKNIISRAILSEIHLDESLAVLWPDIVTVDSRFGIGVIKSIIELLASWRDKYNYAKVNIVILVSNKDDFDNILKHVSSDAFVFFRQVEIKLLFDHLLIE